MSRSLLLAISLASFVTSSAEAQAPSDSADFVVLRGSDTIVVEAFVRTAHELRGDLVKIAGEPQRTRYRASLMDDGSMPLIEFSVWNGLEEQSVASARQTGRVLFKGDSAAVDEADWAGGLKTHLFGTEPGALAYMNLSFAFMEQATRRAASLKSDSASVPFFNLGGGQTLDGTVTRLGTDSALVRLGSVGFRLRVDPEGRIMGGAVPSQGLLVTRTP